MSAPNEQNEIDAVDEELVAYCDGELEPADRERVESRLAKDENYRIRLHQLQKTWDALDLLPKAIASDAFTSTTVSVVVAREEIVASQAIANLKSTKQRSWLWLALVGLAAVSAGFTVAYHRLTQQDRELVRDLTVIENIDSLQSTPSVDFLEKLREQSLFVADSNEN